MTRVAGYCRVSTDKSDQIHSFVSQKSFFSAYISNRPDWILTEIYADEGITGTSTAHRTGFLKMIDDAYLGKFDLIMTKEVSRFSRNILDAISFTRRLKELGVGVMFLNDGISTLDSDAELRLGIMASVAQEESRKTSERVRWGQMRKMECGVVFGRSLLGYTVKNGKLAVEPEGAETIRQIFDMYLGERMGVRAIAKTLTTRKTPTLTGRDVWSGAAVLKILRNEKYCGDLVQRKTVTTDFLTHKKKKNRSDDVIYIRDHHEPIIDRSQWEEAQCERCRRAPEKRESASKGNKYALSGRILCAGCRSPYLCRTRKRKDGSSYRVWLCDRCSCFQKHHQLREDALATCVRFIIKLFGENQLSNGLYDVVTRITRGTDISAVSYEKEISSLENRKLMLIDIFLAGDINRAEYASLKAQYENELSRLGGLLTSIRDKGADGKAAERLEVISSLAAAKDSDGEFYLSLVERIEVKSASAVEIVLLKLTEKWNIDFNSE